MSYDDHMSAACFDYRHAACSNNYSCGCGCHDEAVATRVSNAPGGDHV